MKNHWLDEKDIFQELLCARISCSKDKIPGACIYDLHDCSSLDECLEKAIKRSEELTVIGKADKIVLMANSKDNLFNIPGTAIKEEEKRTTICFWNKIDNVWIKNNEIMEALK